MTILSKLQSSWSMRQERAQVRRATELLWLERDRLRALRSGREVACQATTPDAVARAIGGLKLRGGSEVILLLPPARFSTSSHQFSGLPRDALLRALHYQQDEHFPGMEPLVVTAGSGEQPALALWMRRQEMERWREALKLADLQLTAIGVTLLLRQYLGQHGFTESDAAAGIEIEVDDDGLLAGWSATAVTAGADPAPAWPKRIGKLQRSDYLFVQPARPRATGWVLGLLLALLLVGGLGYATAPLVQELQQRSTLNDEVAALKTQSREVVDFRSQVFALEQSLVPVQAFPPVRIGPLLTTLDRTIPRDSWLSRLEVVESRMEIEGVSPDPSRIVELLSARPEFREVAFSKAIRKELRGGEGKSRFGIRQRLAGIDFERWREAVRSGDE